MTEEIWKVVEGFDIPYEVSTKGRIRGPKGLLLGTETGTGVSVTLKKNGKTTSAKLRRLVAIAFVPNPENHLYVRCKDGNPWNTVPQNLEWFTDHKPSGKRECMTAARVLRSKVPVCPTNCIHNGFWDTNVRYCEYMFNTGQRRPCPAGPGCTVYAPIRKPKRRIAEK